MSKKNPNSERAGSSPRISSDAVAIAEAIKSTNESSSKFKFEADSSVVPIYDVKKGKDGNTYIVETATGEVSELQNHSLEEKRAALNSVEFED